MLLKLVLEWFPKRMYSWVIGSAARSPLSRWLIPLYVRKYGINVDEIAHPLRSYATLRDFFIRTLKPGARTYDASFFLSPVDGLVQGCGTISESMRMQVKGESYRPAQLLGPASTHGPYMGGFYVVLYLSPRDYHRIHMPSSGTLTGWTHVPGRLFPVNRMGVQHVNLLYSRNERVISYISSAWGRYAVVKVGAMGVGTIHTLGCASSELKQHTRVTTQAAAISVERGQELGRFELGSTVILMFERGTAESLLVSEGDRVRCGDPVAVPGHTSPRTGLSTP